jgi:hypothetical protein
VLKDSAQCLQSLQECPVNCCALQGEDRKENAIAAFLGHLQQARVSRVSDSNTSSNANTGSAASAAPPTAPQALGYSHAPLAAGDLEEHLDTNRPALIQVLLELHKLQGSFLAEAAKRMAAAPASVASLTRANSSRHSSRRTSRRGSTALEVADSGSMTSGQSSPVAATAAVPAALSPVAAADNAAAAALEGVVVTAAAAASAALCMPAKLSEAT